MPVGGNALYLAQKNFLDHTKKALADYFNTSSDKILYKEGFFQFNNKQFSLSNLTQLFNFNEVLKVDADWSPNEGTYTYPKWYSYL